MYIYIYVSYLWVYVSMYLYIYMHILLHVYRKSLILKQPFFVRYWFSKAFANSKFVFCGTQVGGGSNSSAIPFKRNFHTDPIRVTFAELWQNAAYSSYAFNVDSK